MAQAGKHIGNRHAGFLARRDDANGSLRVYRQQAEQFGTRVTGAANNADIDHRRPRGHGADSSIVCAFYDIGMDCW
jgi:hypothetical protein